MASSYKAIFLSNAAFLLALYIESKTLTMRSTVIEPRESRTVCNMNFIAYNRRLWFVIGAGTL